MTDDLVTRLREVPSDGTGIINGNYWCRVGELTHQAANRIEQLEAALRYYAKEYENPFGDDDSLIARAALGEKKDGNV